MCLRAAAEEGVTPHTAAGKFCAAQNIPADYAYGAVEPQMARQLARWEHHAEPQEPLIRNIEVSLSHSTPGALVDATPPCGALLVPCEVQHACCKCSILSSQAPVPGVLPLLCEVHRVVVQISVEIGHKTFTDRILWNLADPASSVDGYAITVCRDLKLDWKFCAQIKQAVEDQLLELQMQASRVVKGHHQPCCRPWPWPVHLPCQRTHIACDRQSGGTSTRHSRLSHTSLVTAQQLGMQDDSSSARQDDTPERMRVDSPHASSVLRAGPDEQLGPRLVDRTPAPAPRTMAWLPAPEPSPALAGAAGAAQLLSPPSQPAALAQGPQSVASAPAGPSAAEQGGWGGWAPLSGSSAPAPVHAAAAAGVSQAPKAEVAGGSGWGGWQQLG